MRDGWIDTTLDGIAEYINGDPFKPSDLGEIGLPVIRIKQLLDPNEPVDRTETDTPDRCLLRDGDIVFSWSGTLAVRIWNRGPAKLNQHLFRVVEKKGVYKGIIPLILDHAIEELEEKSHGTTMKHITKQTLLPHKVLLPPLSEQKRIVDLISSVDSYIKALQQQLESAKRSRNAVLHELLTAGGDDWVETTLGEASEVIMGRQLSPSKKLGTRPRPYIRAANIGSWGINLEDIYEMDFTEIEEERFACQVGDTILVEGGNEKSVGCPAFISEKESGLCIQNTVIRCRSTNPKRLDPNFQYHLLRFMFWRGDFAQLCAGTTIMHLGQKRAEVVPISIPPIGEQLDIVDTISKFDLVVSNLGKTLDNAKTLRSGLLSDLLSGEHEIPASYDKVMGAA